MTAFPTGLSLIFAVLVTLSAALFTAAVVADHIGIVRQPVCDVRGC